MSLISPKSPHNNSSPKSTLARQYAEFMLGNASILNTPVKHVIFTPESTIANKISTPEEPSRVQIDMSYKNAQYWQLPENVRNALDRSKIKNPHSDFFRKLASLND